jgi:hypothetical protein
MCTGRRRIGLSHSTRWNGVCAALWLIGACSGASVRPCGPPPKPPREAVVVEGDTERVAAVFGPAGGTLSIKDGLTLAIPPDPGTADATSVELKREEAPGAPRGVRASSTFLETPSLEVRGAGRFRLAIPSAVLTAPCASADWKLAYERPGTVGPGVGPDSPALEWAYEPAHEQGTTLAAELTHLPGMHVVFVCLHEDAP